MAENEKEISILEHMKNLVTVRTFEEEALEKAIQALEEIQQYRAIGTVEEFKALKEKSEPKKILKRGDFYKCPICNHWVGFRYGYCDRCGQKLDFSE